MTRLNPLHQPFLQAMLLVTTLAAGTAQAEPPSEAAEIALQHIKNRGGHQQQPFIVLDKVAARIWVFDAEARAVGTSPVLLGAAVGDHSVPGIGSRPLREIQPHERTTPAGRYRMEPGRNLQGEEIFWVDYDAAVSLHRLRPSVPAERRPQRLASATPGDNRISYGCVNLPPPFFDKVVRPLFSKGSGWIYILPETRPVQTLFETGAS